MSKRLDLTTKLCNSKVFEVQYVFIRNHTHRHKLITCCQLYSLCLKWTCAPKLLTWSPFAIFTLLLDRFHGPHTRVNNCLISYDCGMPVHSNIILIYGTYNANKTRISSYLKFAKRHTRKLNEYCHLLLLWKTTGSFRPTVRFWLFLKLILAQGNALINRLMFEITGMNVVKVEKMCSCLKLVCLRSRRLHPIYSQLKIDQWCNAVLKDLNYLLRQGKEDVYHCPEGVA